MSANADDPLILAAARISDGTPVDWRSIRELLINRNQETIADELEALEQVARASGGEAAVSWGRFTLVEVIGRGRFGTVYRALDPTLQIPVALKIIRPRPGAVFDYNRALQEAQRLARIRHPDVVRVFAAERVGDEVGVSMELVEGRTLDAIVRERGPFSAREAAGIGLDLCRALAAVHGAGLLHGDIKAHNVMRADGGRTMLMDFGAGRDLNVAPIAPGGDFAGTPIYLAPEVFAGANRTPASDIYSLGVLLYFLVTGSFPLEGGTKTEMHKLHEQRGPRRPLRDARPDLPDDFIRTVERALAENPRQRFATAGALESALTSTIAGGSSDSRESLRFTRSQWAAIAAAVVLLVGIPALGIYRGWFPTQGGTRSTAANAAVQTSPTAAAPTPAAAPASAAYRITAGFYRERNGTDEPIGADDRLARGDRLSFHVQVAQPTYVYVVNEDERGESYLLFPLPGQSLTNPLAPGQSHRLPGKDQRLRQLSWQVSSRGGREHFLLVARPERSPEFEKVISTLPAPVLNRPVEPAPLSADALSTLRSVGGLTVSSVVPTGTSLQLHRQPEFSMAFVPGEQTVDGSWVRQATFDNPIRARDASAPPQK
ncbi:MAG TPA: serine/threonine-protein kinase [Vicinamibacterales bacterium]|nr:serine/threonine-protein kinase [Vicinamibacterales bacterium]